MRKGNLCEKSNIYFYIVKEQPPFSRCKIMTYVFDQREDFFSMDTIPLYYRFTRTQTIFFVACLCKQNLILMLKVIYTV